MRPKHIGVSEVGMGTIEKGAEKVSGLEDIAEKLRRDATRYAELGGWYRSPGFWTGAIYRFGFWADSLANLFLRIPLRFAYRLARLLPRYVFNVQLWGGRKGARIGPGLCFIHPSNILIVSGAEIGANCLIFHDVTIGTGPIPGAPRIGNNVDLYVGSKILGGVLIGDNCMIGANCVVINDVPSNSVVMTSTNFVIPRSLSPAAQRAAKS